ncbi:Mannose-P-dolichol utilization defect 1 protein [Mactra antiquata]
MNESSLLVRGIQMVIPEPCYTKVFTDFDFFDLECFKIVISKCLGYSIILGAVLVKLPQILKIINSKSGEGISIFSVLFELVAISSNMTYCIANAFPFSSYGEAIFLCIQTSLVMFLVLFYGNNMMGSFLFLLSYIGIMVYLLSPVAPLTLIETLQGFNIILVIVSKLIQVYSNFQNGSTGQLSAITVGMIFLGSVARIFTSIQETGDSLIILSYASAAVCNAMLVGQMIYYRKPKKD